MLICSVLTVVANMDKVTKIVREILKFTEPVRLRLGLRL